MVYTGFLEHKFVVKNQAENKETSLGLLHLTWQGVHNEMKLVDTHKNIEASTTQN